MKKIFALVLAVAMLSSIGFADVVDSDGDALSATPELTPDSTFYIESDCFVKGASTLDVPNGEFTNANFAVSKRTFSKGANLVKSVTIDDDEEKVAVKLNQDLNLVRPNAATKSANLVIDEIIIKAKKSVENTAAIGTSVAAVRNATYNFCVDNASAFAGQVWVGYTGTKTPLSTSPLEYAKGDLVKFEKDGEISYAIASLDGPDFYMEGRVYDGDKIYTKVSNSADKDILKLYPDADLRFVKFETSGLSANNDVQILADEDEFVYQIVDKKIVKTSLKWNDDVYAWTGKISGNMQYVISDVELKAVDAPAAGETPTNPETGANDVVGVAAALAVVSLVAAGAVSLKK